MNALTTHRGVAMNRICEQTHVVKRWVFWLPFASAAVLAAGCLSTRGTDHSGSQDAKRAPVESTARLTSPSSPAPHQLSIDEALSVVMRSIEAVRQRHQSLPPPRNDAEKLVRIGELDQAPRDAMSQLNPGVLRSTDRQAVWTAVSALIAPLDEDNRRQLLMLVPPEGWFPISIYGRDAARAAFFVIQHGDQALWRRFLPSIEKMVQSGEAEGPSFALMYDRLALSEGRPQRYGSQMSCRDSGYITTQPMEDLSTVDDRRRAIGMIPYAEYLRIYKNMSC
jgi:hypothetical protein